jgi:phosphoribosylpyrophosphate synthetase
MPMGRGEGWVELVPPTDALEAVLALGTYTEDIAHDPVKERRRRTGIGARINQAKYHPERTRTAEEAFAFLSEGLINLAEGHGECAGAGAIVGVPGSGSTTASFSMRLAADVAQGLELPLIEVSSRYTRRVPMKVRQTRRFGDYSIGTDLTGLRVLIVDDVVETGDTLAAIAHAACRAGASSCVGLVAGYRGD